MSSELASIPTDVLLYELLRLTRRQQWQADPLLFAREVFPQHFSKPSAAMHRRMLDAVTGGGGASGVGESALPTETSLPFPSPVSVAKSVSV